MRINLNDPVVQRIIQDDRPIALRKRRRSTLDRKLGAPEDAVVVFRPQYDPKTPSKSKKKVRFSDPGPEITTTTGLTPALRSTSLGTTFGVIERVEMSLPKTPSHRRVTLPPITTAWDSTSPREIQFAPIRQLLTPRLKRQIARKGLSGEMNKIDDEKKLIGAQQAELQELRKELIELRSSKTAADRTYLEDCQLDLPDLEYEASTPELDKDLSSIPDSQDDQSVVSSSPLHDSPGIFIDSDCRENDEHQPKSTTSSILDRTKVHQAIQTDVLPNELELHIQTQTIHLTKARLELERIFPGETTLPLTPPGNGDCSPLLNAMLGHLQTAQASLRTTKQSLSNVDFQKNNLQANFNQSLANLDVARESYAELLRGARAGAEKYAQARQRIRVLETEVDQGNQSADKLRTALDTYRAEVHALESLITRLEEEGKERQLKLKSEMEEAVADLECAVAAETRGRREAESELDSRALQIRVLSGSQRELKEAISEKQALVRNLEDELDQIRSNKEQEVGHLNVRIAKLEEELSCARIDISRLENDKKDLQEQLDNKQNRELSTIGNLKTELRKAVRGVEGIVGGWEKEAAQDTDSVRVAGLMTPSSDGGRFRDVAMDTVDGAVQMVRGKSRKSRNIDSAIGLLDDDMLDA